VFSTKTFLAMIFNEMKCRFNTSLGLVGGMQRMHPPVSTPGRNERTHVILSSFSWDLVGNDRAVAQHANAYFRWACVRNKPHNTMCQWVSAQTRDCTGR